MSADARRARRRARPSRVGSTGARFPHFPVEPDPPDHGEEHDEPSKGAEPGGDVFVGRTGARFGGGTRRARRDAERAAAQDAAVPTPAPPPHRAPEPEPDDAPTAPLPRAIRGVEDTRTRVRPYVRTRGRTRTRADLAVETLVSIPRPRPSFEDPDHAAVDRVCDGPRSVAEVAARLEVPLGVARVVIDDMAAAGLLVVHPTGAPAGAPSRDVMQRVLEGLHRL